MNIQEKNEEIWTLGFDERVTVSMIDSNRHFSYERETIMLDAYIIDQIRRREEERRRINERPALELPLPPPPPPRYREEAEAEPEPRRVVIIDL